MNIPSKSTIPPLLLAILAVVLSIPHPVRAVSIGEIVSQSKLGEPLSIQVALTHAPNEIIDSTCLSLIPPDLEEEGAQDYVASAKVAVKTEMGRQFAIITSHKPFNEAFGKVRLRVNCIGQGSVTKTLTFLPELDAASPPALALTSVETLPIEAPAEMAPLALNSAPSIKKPTVKKPTPRPDRLPTPSDASSNLAQRESTDVPMRAKRKKRVGSENFMFKLSSDPIDESRIGKISSEERHLLLERQKLLDADDQMASYLAMQHQIKQLQDELGEIKLRLTQLSGSSALSSSPIVSASSQAEAGNPSALTLPATNAPPSKKDKFGLLAGGLAISILALLFGLRHYNRNRLQSWESPGSDIEDIAQPAASETMQTERSVNTNSGTLSKVQRNASSITPPAKRNAIASSAISSTPSLDELSEADAIVEEAELYSTYGHPERAILMLQELLQQHPKKVEAWDLLLLILVNLKKTEEFEEAARDFMEAHKSSVSLKKIHALRRKLAQDNQPQIAGSTSSPDNTLSPPDPSKRRLIGKILVETGALSAEEMAGYLDNYDAKLDGRIGEYLVSCKAITNEQLNEALRLQQTSDEGEVHEQYDLATPNVEDFLPDTTGQTDPRLNEYMKMDQARNKKKEK